MYSEIPVLKRCCFCVPLRYGLLVWAYSQLAISLIYSSLDIVQCYIWMKSVNYHTLTMYYVMVTSITSLLMKITFSLLLLVAAHKKNVRVLKISFSIGLSDVIVNTLFLISGTIIDWFLLNHWDVVAEDIVIGVFYLMLTGYLLLLVRSELLKLEGSHQFRFVNTAADAEAECTMNLEKII